MGVLAGVGGRGAASTDVLADLFSPLGRRAARAADGGARYAGVSLITGFYYGDPGGTLLVRRIPSLQHHQRYQRTSQILRRLKESDY